MLSEYEYGFMEAMDGLRVRYLEIQQALDAMPAGSVVIHRHGNQTYYLHSLYVNGERKRNYISNDASNPLVYSLIKKAQNEQTLKSELKSLRKLFAGVKSMAVELYLAEKMHKASSFPSLPSEKQKYADGLIYRSKHGELVRSKSEVLICNALYELGVPYHYEKHWNFGSDFCPDFTIKSPLNGRLVILEHLGLSNDQYSRSWDYKKGVYDSRNIIEGRDLFITTEENISDIKEVLAKFFTYRRYDDLVAFFDKIK